MAIDMLSVRRWHSYVGMFTAPSVLFFTLTGGLQLFGLHEQRDGYTPPSIVEKLSSVHKDQVFSLSDHHPPPGEDKHEGPPGPGGGDEGERGRLPTLLLKLFFSLVAVSLAVSTGFGLWIGLSRRSGRTVSLALLATGTLLPVALLLL